jgi:sialate O-acetylesterase
LTSRDGKPLTHLAIAGDDGNFVAATATVDGSSIVVHSEKVAKPVAARFAWNQEAEPNLANQEGLPASAFQTKSAGKP